jgi:urease accessory protein
MKAFIVAAAALAAFPRVAWAHHFMGGGLPETFAQVLLSGLGHPVIGPEFLVINIAA